MRKVAIFGGTFDPVHWGHLLIAHTAQTQLALDRVIWVPTYAPPHKAETQAPFEDRLAMVKLAIASDQRFVWSDVDADQPQPSYALNTLRALQASEPDAQWFWIIGVDAFQNLPKWRGRAELSTACHWLVAPRSVDMTADVTLQQAMNSCHHVAQQMVEQALELHWSLLEMPVVDISSSQVRKAYRENQLTHPWVPEAVKNYITIQKLYQVS